MGLSTTTSLAVLSTDTVTQNDLLLIDKGLGTEAQRTAGVVSTVSTTSTHDIFGDASAVATYNLDGDAIDLGGTYNGTATNVTYGAGKFGQGAVFNGTSSTINLNYSLNGATSASYSVWFNANHQDGSILAQTSGASCVKTSTGIAFSCKTNTGYHVNTTYDYTDDLQWHNIVFTWNGTTAFYYFDGSQINSSSGGSSLASSGNIFLGNTDTITQYLSGSLDQVRIFNRALTAQEVSRLYTEDYKTVAISPALSAIPTTSETVSSYAQYTNDSYFNKPIDASSAGFTETSTTTTAVYAVGDIIKDTSTNKLYKCTTINTIGILLTDAGYFTGLSSLSVTSGVFTYTDGKNNYGYNRKSDTFNGSVDFSGATDGLKWVGKDLSASTFVFKDTKPTFDTATGLWGGEATPLSFLPNPIQVTSATPQYIDYSDELATNVMDSLSVGKLDVTDGFDLGQTWQDVTRISGVTYTNTTGKPILLVITGLGDASTSSITIDGIQACGYADTNAYSKNMTVIIPNGASYTPVYGYSLVSVAELR